MNMKEVKEMVSKLNESEIMNMKFELIYEENYFYYIKINNKGIIGKMSVESFIDTFKFMDEYFSNNVFFGSNTIQEEEYQYDTEVVEKEDNEVAMNYDLLTIPEKEKTSKKKPMSIYFEESILDILKAISYIKGITVNKLIMYIIDVALKNTIEHIPEEFDVNLLSKQYDIRSKKTGRKKGKSGNVTNNNCTFIFNIK